MWNFANLADVTCEQHLDLARLKAESGGLVFENPFDHKVPKVKQGHSKTKRPQRWNWKVNFWPRLNSPLLAINLGPAFKNSQSCSSQHCHNICISTSSFGHQSSPMNFTSNLTNLCWYISMLCCFSFFRFHHYWSRLKRGKKERKITGLHPWSTAWLMDTDKFWMNTEGCTQKLPFFPQEQPLFPPGILWF